MYKIIVGELNSRKNRGGRVLASERCRISALSSADYCLHGRVEVDWGSFAWRGTARDIRRLFDAERLNGAFLDGLEEGKEYAVLFVAPSLPACA